ncbi:MAG: IclR family transcriptional regulator [Burkholderiales bacterium]|nr:IclR family transcriptional regulator [Burkholderiales bacterium]
MKASTRTKAIPPREKKAGAEKEHGGVQSIARAFAIAEEIARNREGISLAELSKRVGLHNSTTFHLVKTMVQLGYVNQLADSRKYRIGRRMFTLAAGALDEIELVSVATPILEKLTAATCEYSHFAIRSGEQIVVVAKTAGTGIFQMVDRTGAVRPGHATALGKVLLAALSASQLERYLQTCELHPFTAKTIVERGALLRELDEVRRKGLAFDDGEFDAEARCVAVAVRDFTGRVAGAIGMSGPMWRLSLQALQEKSKQVREAASALSAELGFQPQQEPAASIA